MNFAIGNLNNYLRFAPAILRIIASRPFQIIIKFRRFWGDIESGKVIFLEIIGLEEVNQFLNLPNGLRRRAGPHPGHHSENRRILEREKGIRIRKRWAGYRILKWERRWYTGRQLHLSDRRAVVNQIKKTESIVRIMSWDVWILAIQAKIIAGCLDRSPHDLRVRKWYIWNGFNDLKCGEGFRKRARWHRKLLEEFPSQPLLSNSTTSCTDLWVRLDWGLEMRWILRGVVGRGNFMFMFQFQCEILVCTSDCVYSHGCILQRMISIEIKNEGVTYTTSCHWNLALSSFVLFSLALASIFLQSIVNRTGFIFGQKKFFTV